MHSSKPDTALDCSPFLAGLVQRHPDWWAQLEDSGRLRTESAPEQAELATTVTGEGLDPGLRQFRNREMMRIVWRDLNRLTAVENTLEDLSRLAEVCLQAAVEHHAAALTDRYGAPCDADGNPQGLVVIGMGKLGGRELNLSSDIDLIFCYPHAGTCSGPRNMAGEQYFTRLTRAVIRSLSEITEHGFCFRVDARLRPFGESGPLVCSFGAMEQYYQREGRDWERYALVKARPVAGDLEAGEALLRILQPFVYRRYIDFGAIEALQEMHAAVRKDAADRGREQDVKRGPGGIREIEFMIQAHQLLRGGREPKLQTPSLYGALETLVELGMMEPDTGRALKQHYDYLRRLENAIQALHDQQTHLLPAGHDLQRVAQIMGCPNEDGLQEQVRQVRAEVNRVFSQHLQPAETVDDTRWQARWRELSSADFSGDGLNPVVARFLERLGRQSLSQRAAQRLGRFMPLLLEQLDQRNLGDDVLSDVFELVLAISRRSAYLSLLVHKPQACKRMLDLFRESHWVAATVIRHPALLDELIDPALGHLLPTRTELDSMADRIRHSHDEPEAVLQALNHLKLASSLRVAVAEIETTLTARQVQQGLTGLAETLLRVCLEIAHEEIRGRYESPPEADLCVIGYGSLGAGELAYGSDLDLIFLYDGECPPGSDDTPPLERFYTQVARRLISLLTVPTASGKLYETDTRLRPNGRAGLLVSSLQAFGKYQREQAWTWELQALTRARALAGNQKLAQRYSQIRQAVLVCERDPIRLREDITRMRQRMRAEFRSGDRFKHGSGGLVDVDFIAQLGVLECASRHPRVLEATDTPGQLQHLVEAGWLSAAQADVLCETHEALCHERHLSFIARGGGSGSTATTASLAVCREILGDHANSWFSTGSGSDGKLATTPGDHQSG